MSFYSQVKGNDSSYIIILRIMTDYLMFSLDYGGDTNYQAGILVFLLLTIAFWGVVFIPSKYLCMKNNGENVIAF